MPVADAAAVHDISADRRQHRLHARDGVRRAAGHDGDRACGCTARSAGYRRVHHVNTKCLQFRSNPACLRRIAAGLVDDDLACGQAIGKAARAEQRLACDSRSRQAQNNHIAAARQRRKVSSSGRSFLDEALHGFRIGIEDLQRPRQRQTPGQRSAHGTQANVAYGQRSRFRFQRRRLLQMPSVRGRDHSCAGH
ncbi:hypothetical protein D3C86_1543680 [compost metagenome]